MFSRIVTALAVVCATSFAFAGTGKSSFRFYGMGHGGYELAMNGDTITGHIDNLGVMSGKVMLTKKEGKWSGNLGMVQIKAGALIQSAENKTKINMSTLPGCSHSFTLKMKTDELQLNGMMGNGVMVGANMKFSKQEFSMWNQLVSMNIRSKKNDGVYTGTTTIRNWQGHFEYLSTELKTEGDMLPSTIAKNDHALFVLLHVLPFNIYR